MFLKIGRYTINKSSISYINWQAKHPRINRDEDYIIIYLNSSQGCAEIIETHFISFKLDSLEAKALEFYFANCSEFEGRNILEEYESYLIVKENGIS